MRVFIETTIVSYHTARLSRDVLQVARQQVTRDWWDNHRQMHNLFTSQGVLEEAARGDPDLAVQRLTMLAGIPVLEATPVAEGLARQVLDERILPPFAAQDAVFIALSAVHRMDALLSWNCRHLANAALQAPLRRVMAASGFDLPTICTPDELMEDAQ